MLKEAIQCLVSLKENKTYEINGDTYSDHELVRIPPYIPRPKSVSVTSLDSLVKLITREHIAFSDEFPIFVQVNGPRDVSVFTSYDLDDMNRNYLYTASCDVPGFREGFREHEAAIIELQSKFIPGDDVDYLLDILSRVSKESGVTTQDNGVTQTVEARSGIQLKQKVQLRPRVSLRPYRTFLEVEQPESEFLLRMDSDGRVGLFEADGGMWKMDAKKNIAEYFEKNLDGLISGGQVVVMM